jgi:hypothetical protein
VSARWLGCGRGGGGGGGGRDEGGSRQRGGGASQLGRPRACGANGGRNTAAAAGRSSAAARQPARAPTGALPPFDPIRLPNLEANGDFNKAEIDVIWDFQRRSGARSLKFGAWCARALGAPWAGRERGGGDVRHGRGRGRAAVATEKESRAHAAGSLTAFAPRRRRPPTVGYTASDACGADAVPMTLTADAPVGSSGVDPAVPMTSEGLWRCAGGGGAVTRAAMRAAARDGRLAAGGPAARGKPSCEPTRASRCPPPPASCPGKQGAPLETCTLWAADFAGSGLPAACTATPILQLNAAPEVDPKYTDPAVAGMTIK